VISQSGMSRLQLQEHWMVHVY